MCKFKKIIINRQSGRFYNLQYIPDVEKCYRKYFKFLQDDFAAEYVSDTAAFIEKSSPYFWAVLDFDNNFMGFVFLDNFVGNQNSLYSAELTTCFEKRAWGIFTKYSAKIFLKQICFDELGLYKVKVHVYPDNFRNKTLMKNCGFVYESTLIKDTIRFGKPQDIEIYSLYRTYYYKTR